MREQFIDLLLPLEQRYQATSAGQGSGFSLLFEMNTLFEEYIARTSSRALRAERLSVTSQGGRLYCLQEVSTGALRFQKKPDLLVLRHSEVLLIADTTLKRLARHVDDPKRGVSQSDAYQMMAYGRCTEPLLWIA